MDRNSAAVERLLDFLRDGGVRVVNEAPLLSWLLISQPIRVN